MKTGLVDQLPAVLATDRMLCNFVRMLDEVADTVRHDADTIEHVVDVAVTPEPFISWLASWLGAYGVDSSVPEDRRRDLLMSEGRRIWWRGTARGLRELLEHQTGDDCEVRDSGGVYRRDHAPHNTGEVQIRLESSGGVTDQHLLSLVRSEIPADVAFELRVGDRLVWPPVRAQRPPDPEPEPEPEPEPPRRIHWEAVAVSNGATRGRLAWRPDLWRRT